MRLMGQEDGRRDPAVLTRSNTSRLSVGRINLGNAPARHLYREAVACYRDAIALKADYAERGRIWGMRLLEMRGSPREEAACRAIEKPEPPSPYYARFGDGRSGSAG
jgi:hypothetical protein